MLAKNLAQPDSAKAHPPALSSADPERWEGVIKPYTKEDVERLRGSFRIEYTLAREGAKRLWSLLKTEPPVTALGALSGNQAYNRFAPGLKPFISAVGRSLPMVISPSRCTRTKAYTRRIVFQQ
jgi:hypothetical protein